jgi:oligopeptidase B
MPPTIKTNIPAPKAKKISKQLTIHNHTRIDEYYYLNEKDNPEVIEYLNQENAYTKMQLSHTESFQKKLFKEIKGRIKETDMSVPYFINGYWYYSRYEQGQEYPIYCRKKLHLDAAEQIMLNANELAKDSDYFHIADFEISADNQLMAFSVDYIGRRQYSINFKDLSKNQILLDKVENTNGSMAWANDNKTLFYAVNDSQTLRSCKIFKHELSKIEDELVFFEQDEAFTVEVFKNKSRSKVIISCHSTLSTEERMLDPDHPLGEFHVFHHREKDLEYSTYEFNDQVYILTNYQAKNFRLMRCDKNNTSKENWIEFLAHRDDVLIEGLEVFKDFIAIEERINGLINIRIIYADGKENNLKFNDPCYTAAIAYNPEFDTEKLRYGYTSLTTPNSTFEYDVNTQETTLLKQQEVLSNFNPQDYTSKRLFATAKDGTLVPISMVFKKDIQLNGKNPLLLYGYGSYGVNMDAYFSSVRLSILDRGFIYAIAHVRGGQELGRKWYESGKLLAKKNTFTDFISCAEFLIEQQYTNADLLFAEGGSAGGLLMGAVINLRPELFKGIIAAVPFVDVLTTMLDETIPLTTGEYDEWGDPRKKEYYQYMLSYSPYDNVESKKYPAMLVTTGLHDSQVQYWEPAKWVAKLRDLKKDNNLLLLRTDMSAGHGGKSGRFQHLKDIAQEYAFLFNLIGIKK